MIKTEDVAKTINAIDRCDSCSASARVIVTFINGELMFCGHHARELSVPLLNTSISIYDPDDFI